MVIKRYIKRNGKVLGPYYYKNVRDENGKVKSIYLGTEFKEDKLEVNPKSLIKPCLLVFVVLALVSVSFFEINNTENFVINLPENKITGLAVSDTTSNITIVSIILILIVVWLIVYIMVKNIKKNRKQDILQLKLVLNEGFGLMYKNDYESATKLYIKVHLLMDKLIYVKKELRDLYREYTLYVFCYNIGINLSKAEEIIKLALIVFKNINYPELYKKAEEHYKKVMGEKNES